MRLATFNLLHGRGGDGAVASRFVPALSGTPHAAWTPATENDPEPRLGHWW